MAREKFGTLTAQMFYILLVLQEECYGMDIMEKVSRITDGRISVGAGTLYNLLDSFMEAEIIYQTKQEGRKRSYLLTQKGKQTLDNEYLRLQQLTSDYKQYRQEENNG